MKNSVLHSIKCVESRNSNFSSEWIGSGKERDYRQKAR